MNREKIVRLANEIMEHAYSDERQRLVGLLAEAIGGGITTVSVGDLLPADTLAVLDTTYVESRMMLMVLHATGSIVDPDQDEDEDEGEDENERSALSRVFAAAWDVVALRVQCDDRGGAQYQRLLQVWLDAPGESGVVSWIRAAVRQSDRALSVDARPAVDSTPDEIAAHEAR